MHVEMIIDTATAALDVETSFNSEYWFGLERLVYIVEVYEVCYRSIL